MEKKIQEFEKKKIMLENKVSLNITKYLENITWKLIVIYITIL